MMLQPIIALAAAIPLAASFPAYKLPVTMFKAFLEADGCALPDEFEIRSFEIWSPAARNNNHTAVINFSYADEDTGIQTSCHYNSTSLNVGPVGLVPRYACDNDVVQFIWQNGTLTVIEKACPEIGLPRGFEASGSVIPELSCVETQRNGTFGEGNSCVATKPSIVGNFTSLQPTPE
ncbi:hypothetical protein VTK56DRAFT_4738 [Thermocarpiscus australiensis]